MESRSKKTEAGGPAKREPKVRKEKAPVQGSPEARRTAAAILEVMSGVKGPNEASDALGISTMRYYALEDRALQAMVLALEPRPRGRKKPSADEALLGVQRERDQLRRDLGRTQALLRLVRKSVKLQEPVEKRKGKGKGKGKRRQSAAGRTPKLLARLVEPAPTPAVAGA